MNAFDEWYDGMVGFYINSERILDDLMVTDPSGKSSLDPVAVRKWMKICWNNAIDAAVDKLPELTWISGSDLEDIEFHLINDLKVK